MKNYPRLAKLKKPTNPDADKYNSMLDDLLEMKCSPPVITNSFNSICAFECKVASAPQPLYPWDEKKANQKEEGNTQMNTYNEVEATRKYLNNRIRDAKYTVRDTFRTQFRLDNASVPTNYKELIDAIKNDKYTIDAKEAARVDGFVEDEGRWYGNLFTGMKFKLDTAPDIDGFFAAEKAMEKVYKDAVDTINVADAAAGLKALQDFEGWTYTAPTTTTVQ